MEIGTFYAIRQVGTRKWMPHAEGAYTHHEPQAGCIPRLFTKASAAQRAISAWKKGKARKPLAQIDGDYPFPEVDNDSALIYSEVPARGLVNLEVVPIKLIALASNGTA